MSEPGAWTERDKMILSIGLEQGHRIATEAIVRWLRTEAKRINDERYERNYVTEVLALERAALCIEDGDHLKPADEGPST